MEGSNGRLFGYGNKLAGSIKDEEFLEQQSHHQLLMILLFHTVYVPMRYVPVIRGFDVYTTR
jgi:hypothetical protein